MQRIAIHTKSADQQSADLAYWLAQPIQARIDALEALRQQQGQADIRIQRVCRVTQLKPDSLGDAGEDGSRVKPGMTGAR
jgi:hypothetical protein